MNIKTQSYIYVVLILIGMFIISWLLSGCGTTKCPKDNGWRFSLENEINNEDVETSSQNTENYGKVL